ncbi:MAG TPA: dienelactone hydrolase family protein [Vicinamibacterales bacterium]|jgi:carboxymethylenebutenolidase|nr:dienelactone hydrolase family protein [Vicinamibacterales bacterium]
MANEQPPTDSNDLSRRQFVTLSVAAGLAAAAGTKAVAQAKVVETDVEVKTQDGTCDAALIHPAGGTYPGVIIWPDAFGLRPAMRDMAKRLAADGYTVLVPNPYYRVTKAPGVKMEGFSFQNADSMAELRKLMGGIGAAGAAERDAVAYVAFLDSHASVNKSRKIGVQGYCMGGPLTFRTAAAVPDRIGAAGSFHGGGLVTQAADSPHMMIPKMKARLYVAVAANDDQRQPDAKDVLKKAFADAKVPAEVEVYPSLHGWCVPDMPAEQGKPIYNKADAEKAWTKLVALYKQALV